MRLADRFRPTWGGGSARGCTVGVLEAVKTSNDHEQPRRSGQRGVTEGAERKYGAQEAAGDGQAGGWGGLGRPCPRGQPTGSRLESGEPERKRRGSVFRCCPWSCRRARWSEPPSTCSTPRT